jgi:DNA-binding beta-propeller fold protein YncE
MHNWFGRAFSVSALVLCAVPALAQDPAKPGACNQATPEPILHVDLPGRPFSAIPARDGCWVFVSVTGAGQGSQNGIAVLRRAGGKVSLARVVPTEGPPLGSVLTHDGKLLIVASGVRVAFLDTGRMISGQGDAVLGYLKYDQAPMSIYVNVTADDRFLFVSDEAVQTITVVNLEQARNSGFSPDSVVGKIPAGIAPIALTFSPDERYLYTTSQLAPPSYGWPAECKPEGKASAEAKAVNPPGALLVVDVAKARSDPANAVIAKVPAGCSPVRLALSPKGNLAYVTARNDNALLVFDTGKLTTDPEHALLGKAPVGSAPVGVAVVDRGIKIVVANSNRFFAGPNDKSTLTVIDATKGFWGAAAVLGTIPTGAFPRELQVTADQRTLLVSNFASRTLELVDLRRLPLRP